jgi:hypothetical protein
MNALELYLLRFINNTKVLPDGTVYEIKQLMGRINGLKIEMYPNDHNPPHFHVKTNCGTIDATFKLEDGSLLNGEIERPDLKRIQAFFNDHKDELRKYWEEKRTTNN